METSNQLHFQTKRSTVAAAEDILGLYFPVLDHGFVALVDYMGTDEDVERAARVSYGAGTRKKEQTRGLIRYLRRHKHTTPSEMVELKFHCCMPIFVARQWIRHRTANVNEMSGRYSLLPMLFYTPEKANFQPQSKTNNQGRAGEEFSGLFYETATQRWRENREVQAGMYEWLTMHDVAREISRIDLPLSTYTQWYWKIDLHNLMHFLGLRVDSHAQYEIRAFGNIMAGMLKRVAPLSFEAWMDYDVTGTRLSRMELDAIRTLVSTTAANGLESGKAVVGAPYLSELGLSTREIEELMAKLKPRIPPVFDLDLSVAKPGSYFEEKFAEAVPKGDAPPSAG